jgi:hypothetical protein
MDYSAVAGNARNAYGSVRPLIVDDTLINDLYIATYELVKVHRSGAAISLIP